MKTFWTIPLVMLLFLVSCSDKSNEEQLFPASIIRQAEKDLMEKSEYLTGDNSIWEWTRQPDIPDNEQSALTWIYAYSWTPDIFDHTVDYHLKNIQIALQARNEMPWGKSVPADQWRHFVLPLRVNNEILDDFRTVYYEELRDLVQGMTMEEAVLEINHWAHQHITYAPSDGRTSSPIATMRNALGRCGEQSTLMATALRTVGIPARQVYTPRWAHTDDNHAWVEAWVDGEWKYLGASEPAPVLNNAWFDGPVLRAMLLHTKAFGPYSGPEEWLGENYVNTELNVSENYIPTAQAKVQVKDQNGNPMSGVTVTFRLYNYAELYPLVTRTTNKLGEASVKVGYGDVIAVASKGDDLMAIGQISVKEGGTTLEMILRPYSDLPDEEHYRIVPPVARVPKLEVSEEMVSACNARIEENNNTRQAYTATFPTEDDAVVLADRLELEGKSKSELIRLYPLTRGYHESIEEFLVSAKDKGKAKEAVLLLSSLMEKDLHDVDIEALQQALSRDLTNKEWQDPRIISPRVMLEHIYQAEPTLKKALAQISARTKSWDDLNRLGKAEVIAQAIGKRVDERYNPNMLPINPANVYKYGIGDSRSLTILLVRLLRTARIPAEYDAANSVVRIWDEKGKSHIIPFLDEKMEEDEEPVISAECELKLSYKSEGYLKQPKYYTHFTVGYIDEGQLKTYEFDYDQPYDVLNGEKLVYPNNYTMTGVRLADGSVLMRMAKITCGQAAPLIFDQDEDAASVIGNLNAETPYFDLKSETENPIIETTGRGFYILVLGRNHHEPTDHILRDIHKIANEDGGLPLPTIVLTADNTAPTDELQALLPNAVWGEDKNNIADQVIAGCQLPAMVDMPLVVIADTFNRVVFVSQGYTIGIGDRLQHVIAQVKD